jgi:hypothetical protein
MLHIVTFFILEYGGSIFARSVHNCMNAHYRPNPDMETSYFSQTLVLVFQTTCRRKLTPWTWMQKFVSKRLIWLHSITIFNPEGGRRMFFWNVGNYFSDYTEPHSSTMKMEAAGLFETLIMNYHIIQRHIWEDITHHYHRRENLKPRRGTKPLISSS